MKIKILVACVLFIIGCKKTEFGGETFGPLLPAAIPLEYSVEGNWLLTSAKRITRHTTENWGDSINYFWYPDGKYPLKYNRNRIYDTINVGITQWIITEDKISQGDTSLYYERRNANTPYCDQLNIDFYDTYMIVGIDSNRLILETNKQTDYTSGLFLFDHFTILEFQRIDSAIIHNNHHYNSTLSYCLELNKYDTAIVWNSQFEVSPYNPYL